MARFRQVTRTIEYTEAVLMTVNTDLQTVENIEVELSGTFENDDKLLKFAQETVAEDKQKFVSVVSAKVTEKTFCMPETMFIAQSMPLPVGKKCLTKKDFEDFYNEEYEGEDGEE